MFKCKFNLAKLDCGLDQSPTVIVGETKQTKKSVKKGAYQTPVEIWLRQTIVLQVTSEITQNILSMSYLRA